MLSKTNEQALEQTIEKYLTGTCQEELKEMAAEIRTAYSDNAHNKYYIGFNSDFNKEYAIDERRFWDFLESTQASEIEKLKRDSQYKQKLYKGLIR